MISADSRSFSRTHRAKVEAHAAQVFPATLETVNLNELSRRLRAFLKLEEERLHIAHRLGATGSETARARSIVLDVLLTHVFHIAARNFTDERGAQMSCAIVAIGGYGRCELAPYSDLDLLLLQGERHTTVTRELFERVLHPLWDAGLTIGQRSLSVRECLSTMRSDPHFHTALATTRFVAGDRTLFEQLNALRKRQRRKNADAFISSIRRACDERHFKHGAIIYLQEPNVKESMGGLRDLHAAMWAAEARYGCATLEELHGREIISAEEFAQVTRAYDFLLCVRQEMHWMTGRKTDRLALDLQSTLARKFGYEETPHLLASEQFMRGYYRRAREVHLFSELLLERVAGTDPRPARWFVRPRREHLAGVFVIKERQLHLAGDAASLSKNPLLFFEAVALAQVADVSFSHEVRTCITRHLSTIERGFQRSTEAAQLFISLLNRRGRVGHALRLMHETGLLGRYLPEFARIQMLIQHDLYHHYTIDEHTLRAVEALDQLITSEDRARSYLRAALAEVENVALLYLSLLLHDIGKGHGHGHVARGTKITERICERLPLDAGSRSKVVRTVKHHVLMAHVSQRRDLRDMRTAADFAAQVGTLDELNMLLLLTYADMNAVGPGVWSEWKSALLQDLYTRARSHVSGGEVPLKVSEHIAELKDEVIAALVGEVPTSEIERHFALLSERYTRHLNAETVLMHLRLITRLQTDALACHWTPHANHATGLTIAVRDRRGLFADVAGALAAQGLEILSADLNTRDDRIAIDSLVLREAATHIAVDQRRWPAIERAIAAALAGEYDVAAAVTRWRTRHAPRRTKSQLTRPQTMPAIVCDNESADSTTIVEVHAADEYGLAYQIAHVIASCGFDIVCAKIATEKSDALDVFYVTDADGLKLTEDAMQTLVEALTISLSPTRVKEQHVSTGGEIDPAGPSLNEVATR